MATWETAKVVAIKDETENAKSFRFALDRPRTHRAGQHYVLRLTAPDGYTASRSYSIASPPDGTNEFELTIERLEDGEVSSFMHDAVEVGDELEVRGPIGGFFVWDADTPAVLVGGGSGVVPLMAMLRLARREQQSQLVKLLVSVRTPGDLYYADELPGPETTVIYTREAPSASPRAAGRLTRDDLAPLADGNATAFVCGSSAFADAAGMHLMKLGFGSERIRIERFGATG
jgi:ferredoxin-NADP reductase